MDGNSKCDLAVNWNVCLRGITACQKVKPLRPSTNVRYVKEPWYTWWGTLRLSGQVDFDRRHQRDTKRESEVMDEKSKCELAVNWKVCLRGINHACQKVFAPYRIQTYENPQTIRPKPEVSYTLTRYPRPEGRRYPGP